MIDKSRNMLQIYIAYPKCQYVFSDVTISLYWMFMVEH